MKYRILLILIAFGLNASAQKKQAVAAPKVAVQSDSLAPVPAPAVKKKGIEVNPVKVWRDGKTLDGVDLDVDVAYEDLDKMVRFYYQLKDSAGVQIANGNVEVTGEDYEDYKTKPNHAQRAYQIVLRHLRLQQKPQTLN
jgi:hypothetical protein